MAENVNLLLQLSPIVSYRIHSWPATSGRQ